MRNLAPCAVFFAILGFAFGQAKLSRQPVIDVHMHSQSVEDLKNAGPNPVTGKKAPESVTEHIRQTLAEMDRFDIVLGLVSGSLEEVEEFRQAAPSESGPGRGSQLDPLSSAASVVPDFCEGTLFGSQRPKPAQRFP